MEDPITSPPPRLFWLVRRGATVNIIVSFTPARLTSCRPRDERVGGTTWAPTAKRASGAEDVIPFSLLLALSSLLLSLSLLWLLRRLR